MDCRYCEIQVEITKRAYAARCPNPVAVLEYIRERMKMSSRPRVDISDMKRSTLPAQENTLTLPDDTDDMLTSAAKAIGTTLGNLAATAGTANPPANEPAPAAPKTRATAAKKKPAAKKSVAKKPVAAKAPKKAAPKKSAPKKA